MTNPGRGFQAEKRLGFTFHRTFSLARSAVSQVMNAAQEAGREDTGKLERKKITAATSLGTIYIEAMPRYARGAGLLDQKYLLTNFGKFVVDKDINLDQINTQWLMHYHLSAKMGPGPAFWNQIVSKFFYPGNVFANEEVADFIGNFVWEKEGKILSKRAVQSTATVFLGTYTKPEGLGKLQILQTSESGRYRVRVPIAPSLWVIGYALLDYWTAIYPGRISVSLETLKDSGLAQLFLLGKSDLDEALQCLQELKYAEVHRTAPPYEVFLLRKEQEPILDKIYGSG